MKKTKVLLGCLGWILLFIVVQLFLYIGMTYFFQKEAYLEYKYKYPNVQIEENDYINAYLNAEEYPSDLYVYMEKHAYVTLFVNLLLFLPFLIYFYPQKGKWKAKSKISFIKSSILGVSLAFFLNIIIDCFFPTPIVPISFWVLLSTGIVGPLLEEFLFRGILYEKCKRVFSKKTTFCLVTLAFACIHTGITILYALFMGMLFLYLREKGDHLKPAIYAHIVSNFFVPLCTPYLFTLSMPLKIALLLFCLFTFLYFLLPKKQNI